MKLSLFELVYRMLQKKAKWKALDPKARKWAAGLLVCALYCLIAAMVCVVAIVYKAPKVEIFQTLGLVSVIAWVTLTFMALASNVAGVAISRAERYHRLNPAAQKYAKGLLTARMPALCTSYRAGNSRARRSPSRSHASKDSSADGESNSGEGDPPALRSLSSLFLRPHLTFLYLFYILISIPFPRRSLFGPGCWCIAYDPLFAERGWRL